MARPRLGGPPNLVAARCRDKLRGRLGTACTLPDELARPEVLLVNKSRPPATP